MIKSEYTLEEALKLYKEYNNLHKVAKILHTSHISLSKYFKEHNINILNIGKRHDFSEEEINDMILLYNNGGTIETVSKKFGLTPKKVRKLFKEKNIIISKWKNHIKENEIKKEPKIDDRPYKICPYCGWKTYDITGEKHSYARHLLSKHKLDLEKHLEIYPEDKEIIGNTVNYQKRITCAICGKKLFVIDDRHLKQHGITKEEYRLLYPNNEVTSIPSKIKLQKCMELMMDNQDWDRKSSNYEKEIQEFLQENNIVFETHNRTILNDGKEIDIYLPYHQIAIEFNGNMWHTEWFGKKNRQYHLSKLNQCNNKGVKLISIFEDEYVYHKNIVFNKILHILKLDKTKCIMARKCNIKEINASESFEFLNKYHIQGFASSTLYLGAFYNEELVAVMSFKKDNKNNNNWELSRFATSCNVAGIGGKLFNFFIKEYTPDIVKSFADRRWTIDGEDNFYTKIGFKLDNIVEPDYKYYNPKYDKFKRVHKFNFRKKTLNKKYGFPLSMTETEMVKELGYDRIWDCGLFKYVWETNKR